MPSKSNQTAAPTAWAAPGLHDQVARIVAEHAEPGAKILDLAAGAGGLSWKLARRGYDVHAADYMAESFQPDDIPITQVDFDAPEQTCRLLEPVRAEMLLACEVIEHLRSPLAFLEMCNALLETGRKLLVSLPNITRPSSRANILVNGWANSFGPGRWNVGHITPLFPMQVADMLQMSGFEVIASGSAGPRSTLLPREFTLRGLAQTFLTALLRPLMRNVQPGACVWFVARKVRQAGQLPADRPAGTGTGDTYRVRKTA